jgi:inner membrane protein
MNPVTHYLVGWMVSQNEPETVRIKQRTLIALAGVAPDFDGVGIIAEVLTRNSPHPLPWFSEYHHILGHNITAAAVCTGAVYLLSGRSLKTTGLACLSFHLHLLCDVLGARGPEGYQWPIPYLLPFSHSMDLTWSGQWALNAWPNFLLTFILLGMMFYFAWKRGYSPLEMLSQNYNRVFVDTLRKRFGQPKTER